MSYRLRQIDPTDKFFQTLCVDLITEIVPLATIREVLAACDAYEQRRRKLPAELVVLLCIAMTLYAHDAIDDVLTRLFNVPRLLADRSLEVVANKASISLARTRLGAAPLEALFRRVCQPIAEVDTPGAWLFGLRGVALDGPREDLVDTAENAAAFGYPQSKHGAGAWPQTRCVYLCECGTHVIFDADMGPCHQGELPACRKLVQRSVTPEMLVLVDRGLSSYDMLQDIRQKGAHALARVEKRYKLTPIEVLPDGSYLATLSPGDYPRRKHEHLWVRVVCYQLNDPDRPGHGEPHRLITTLLDPAPCSATDLVCAYHERWEIEITIDELDTHQRLADRPLRSRKPAGVRQELFALLIAHFIVRVVMHQAARPDLDPDRLSFLRTLRLIRDALPIFQMLDPVHHPRLWRRLLADVRHRPLPPRDGRINPRVIKKRNNRFPRKRKHHQHPPQPTKPFREAVVIV